MLEKLKGLFRSADNDSPHDLFPFETEPFYQDPYPYYERLRREQPLYQASESTWVLSRYIDIVKALRHSELGNRPSRFSTLHETKRDRFVCADVANNIMPFLDGPVHEHQRKIIGKAFRESVKRISSELDEIAGRYVEQLPLRFEIMSELATPFAMEVICRILGIPMDAKLKVWSERFFYLFTKIPSIEVRTKVDENLTAFRDWLREVIGGECSGVAGYLKEAVDQRELEETVALDSMILFFADGLENVDSGIGNVLYVLASRPGDWRRLREDRGLLEGTVAECLRFESPAQYIARTCLSDFCWDGQELKKDCNVILLLGSANRDSAQFDQPDHFDLTRSPNRHLSFGLGRHSCLGANLVEQEFMAITDSLTKRFVQIQPDSSINWQKRKGHRWIDAGIFEGK